MNTELLIARRIIARNKGSFSRPIVLVAMASIILGLTIMFVSIAILTGFQREIREKVIGFGGHIQIAHFSEHGNFESKPIERYPDFLPKLSTLPGVRKVQAFGIKAGIIKSEQDILGVVLKGVGADYDLSFFKQRLVGGRVIAVTDTGRCDEVMVSKSIADKLQLKLNDDLRMYFIGGQSTLGRKFRISGIYETGLEEFDKMYVIGDMHHVRKLNNWQGDQVGGFEVLLNDFDDLDRIGREAYQMTGFNMDASTIQQLYPQIFDWLNLQDMNVVIILALMVMVSAITMISTLLILILERTNMIGILKALGMRNTSIRKIFLYNAAYIIGLGLLFGNLLSFSLCLIQQKTGIVRLSQESYYVPVVPIHLDPLNILALNLGTLLVCILILIGPSMVIMRITPLKAIRFS